MVICDSFASNLVHDTFSQPIDICCVLMLVDFVKDVEADLRGFHGISFEMNGVTHESFAFDGNSTVVVLSVDYVRSGT